MTPAELRSRNFVSVKESAVFLSDDQPCDERTVRRAIEAGQIPAVKVGNKTLIPARWLADLVDPQEIPDGAALLATVDTSTPHAITAAVEILRGALRALEALAPPEMQNGPAPQQARPNVTTTTDR